MGDRPGGEQRKPCVLHARADEAAVEASAATAPAAEEQSESTGERLPLQQQPMDSKAVTTQLSAVLPAAAPVAAPSGGKDPKASMETHAQSMQQGRASQQTSEVASAWEPGEVFLALLEMGFECNRVQQVGRCGLGMVS